MPIMNQYYYHWKSAEPLLGFHAEKKVKHFLDYGDVTFSLFSLQPNYRQNMDTLSTVYHCGEPLAFCDFSAKDREEGVSMDEAS